MSVASVTKLETPRRRNSNANGNSASVLHAVSIRRNGKQRTTATHSLPPSYAIVVDHFRDRSREAHVFCTIEGALAFELPGGDNPRVVRIPGDLVCNERALWEHIDLMDREARSVPIPR